jgi:hypothetical protein
MYISVREILLHEKFKQDKEAISDGIVGNLQQFHIFKCLQVVNVVPNKLYLTNEVGFIR